MDDAFIATNSSWTVAAEVPCALGESPFWHPLEERLYWVDILLQRIWRLNLVSGVAEHWELPSQPCSIAPTRSGGLLMALRDGIYLSAQWGDTPQLLVSAPYDPAHMRFNDGKCDPWGRFWVGTYAESEDLTGAGLYCLPRRTQQTPELLAVHQGVANYNGLGWSRDGKWLYWADTRRHQVMEQGLQNPGQFPPQAGPALPLARFEPKPEGWTFEQAAGGGYGGRPDGAAVDAAGRYWIAMYEGARVVCLSPQGQILAELATPAQCPTMVCFGGKDLRTLYLTTARVRRSPTELQGYPHSGSVFALKMNIPGAPVGVYED